MECDKPRRKTKPMVVRNPVNDVDRAALVHHMLAEYFDSPDEATKFMRAHPSTTISIPGPHVIEKLIAENRVVTRLGRRPSREAMSRHRHVSGMRQSDISRAIQTRSAKKKRDGRYWNR